MLKISNSLGIEITDSCISFALVAQEKNKVRILKAGQKQVPPGAMQDSNVVDPVLIAKVLKELIPGKMTRNCKTTVSLVANPLLTQIMDLPEEMPGNIGQFVHSEIKHCAFLVGKETLYDFYGLGKSVSNEFGRVFVAATDKDKISNLLKALSLAGITPETIEPAMIGWVRSLYDKNIKGRYKSNVLLAKVADSILNICVFRKGDFDFIRSIDIGDKSENIDGCLDCCKNEIKAIFQYYDIEFEAFEKTAWEVVVELPGSKDDVEKIKADLNESLSMDVRVCSGSSIYSDAPIAGKDSGMKTSHTAIGLAMSRLKVSGPIVKTNLIPNEVKDTKAARKMMLMMANGAAAVLLAIFVIAGFVGVQYSKAQTNVLTMKENSSIDRIEGLIAEQKGLETKLASLADKKDLADQTLKNQTIVNWAQVLEEIGRIIPSSVNINIIESSGDRDVEIRGKALSPDAVNTFAKRLGMSDTFESSDVQEINAMSAHNGLVIYSIISKVIEGGRLHAKVD